MPGCRRRTKGKGWSDWLKKGHDFIKSNKLISGAAHHAGHPNVSKLASMLGYGKRRATRRRGRGFLDGAFDWASDLGSKVSGQKINSGDWQNPTVNWLGQQGRRG